jgi:hypothetical protein
MSYISSLTNSGIILGPIESYLALRFWFEECIDNLSQREVDFIKRCESNLTQIPRLSVSYKSVKESLIDTMLLYGSMNSMSGKYIFDTFLNFNGVIHNRSEVWCDLLHNRYDPFSNDISDGFLSFSSTQYIPDDKSLEQIKKTIISIYNVLGFEDQQERITKLNEFIEDKRRKSMDAFKYFDLECLFNSIIGCIDNSIYLDIPIYTSAPSIPTWKRADNKKSSIAIIEVIWDEIKWFPKPNTIMEALKMLDDERIINLRKYIQLWAFKLSVGDFTDLNDIRCIIKQEMNWFKRKSWVSQVAKYSTYISLPIGIAEVISKTTPVGLTISSIGFATQIISDLIEKNKNLHWIAMGEDFLKRKNNYI